MLHPQRVNNGFSRHFVLSWLPCILLKGYNNNRLNCIRVRRQVYWYIISVKRTWNRSRFESHRSKRAQTASFQPKIRTVTSRTEEKPLSYSSCFNMAKWNTHFHGHWWKTKESEPHYSNDLRSEIMDNFTHFSTPSCFKSHPELVTQGLQQCSAFGQWSPLTSTQVWASRESQQGYDQTNTALGYADDTISMRYQKKKISSGKHEEIKRWHEQSEEPPCPLCNCSHPAAAGKRIGKCWRSRTPGWRKWTIKVVMDNIAILDYGSWERYQSLVRSEQAKLRSHLMFKEAHQGNKNGIKN